MATVYLATTHYEETILVTYVIVFVPHVIANVESEKSSDFQIERS